MSDSSEVPDTGAAPIASTESTAAPAPADTGAAPAAAAPADKDSAAQDRTSASKAEGKGDGDAKPKNVRDAVRDALKKDAKAKQADSPSADAKTETEATEQEATTTDANAEPEVPVEFNKHPAWQRIMRERNTARNQTEKFKADATDYRKITGAMQQAGISPEEFGESFKLVATMKSNPAEALKMLKPLMERLSLESGESLPEDIRKRVDDGNIDRESAAELARARATAQRAEESAREAAEQTEADRAQAFQTSIRSAVNSWAEQVSAKDADYPVKQAFVTDRIKALVRERPPTSPEEAVNICKQALKEVTERLKPMTGRNQAAMTTVRSDLSQGRAAPAQPKTYREVVRGALAR